MTIRTTDTHRIAESIVTVKGMKMKIASYQPLTEDEDELIREHEFRLQNAELCYYQTKQMHTEIAANENCTNPAGWPLDMQEQSRDWLKRLTNDPSGNP